MFYYQLKVSYTSASEILKDSFIWLSNTSYTIVIDWFKRTALLAMSCMIAKISDMFIQWKKKWLTWSSIRTSRNFSFITNRFINFDIKIVFTYFYIHLKAVHICFNIFSTSYVPDIFLFRLFVQISVGYFLADMSMILRNFPALGGLEYVSKNSHTWCWEILFSLLQDFGLSILFPVKVKKELRNMCHCALKSKIPQ